MYRGTFTYRIIRDEKEIGQIDLRYLVELDIDGRPSDIIIDDSTVYFFLPDYPSIHSLDGVDLAEEFDLAVLSLDLNL